MGRMNNAALEHHLHLRLQWATNDEPLALVMFDVDNFGAVNKQLSVRAGRAVAPLLHHLQRAGAMTT